MGTSEREWVEIAPGVQRRPTRESGHKWDWRYLTAYGWWAHANNERDARRGARYHKVTAREAGSPAERTDTMERNDKNLGVNQQGVLRSLREHGPYRPGCGWLWDTPSGTVRILESLVRRGLVEKVDKVYRLAHEAPADTVQLPKFLRDERTGAHIHPECDEPDADPHEADLCEVLACTFWTTHEGGEWLTRHGASLGGRALRPGDLIRQLGYPVGIGEIIVGRIEEGEYGPVAVGIDDNGAARTHDSLGYLLLDRGIQTNNCHYCARVIRRGTKPGSRWVHTDGRPDCHYGVGPGRALPLSELDWERITRGAQLVVERRRQGPGAAHVSELAPGRNDLRTVVEVYRNTRGTVEIPFVALDVVHEWEDRARSNVAEQLLALKQDVTLARCRGGDCGPSRRGAWAWPRRARVCIDEMACPICGAELGQTTLALQAAIPVMQAEYVRGLRDREWERRVENAMQAMRARGGTLEELRERKDALLDRIDTSSARRRRFIGPTLEAYGRLIAEAERLSDGQLVVGPERRQGPGAAHVSELISHDHTLGCIAGYLLQRTDKVSGEVAIVDAFASPSYYSVALEERDGWQHFDGREAYYRVVTVYGDSCAEDVTDAGLELLEWDYRYGSVVLREQYPAPWPADARTIGEIGARAYGELIGENRDEWRKVRPWLRWRFDKAAAEADNWRR